MKINMWICGTEMNMSWALRDRPQSQILGQAQPTTYWHADLEQASVNHSFFDSNMRISPTYLRQLPREVASLLQPFANGQGGLLGNLEAGALPVPLGAAA